MEKTLRKCGTSSANINTSHLDIDSIPFDIPKRYKIQVENVAPYELNMAQFSYDFGTEEQVLKVKAEREAAQAEVQAAHAEQQQNDSNTSDTSDDVEVLPPELHPTNPFLSYSGETLVPTLSTVTTQAPSKPLSKEENDDIVNFFDHQNTNPFDGVALQSISNMDALRSVLAPSYVHDMSALDLTNGEQSEAIYANSEDPIYATVNKAPSKIVSSSLDRSSSIKVSTPDNGYPATIHSSYTALGTSGTFSIDPPSLQVPDEVVARVTQRLNHDQEACFAFLKDVLELMKSHECEGSVAESVCMMCEGSKGRGEMVTLIKQFTELGFSTDDIIVGLSNHPTDRDALLDYLTSR